MHVNLRPVWGILPVRSQWSYSCSFGGATAQAEREAAAKATRRARAEAAEEQEVLRKQESVASEASRARHSKNEADHKVVEGLGGTCPFAPPSFFLP